MKTPYYAVIFTSILNQDSEGYLAMAEQMEGLAKEQKGFLGIDSARNEIGITISYWKDEESIKTWKQQNDHIMAQKMGKEKWYKSYSVRVARVEREYGFRL